jgi:hypothetical protein
MTTRYQRYRDDVNALYTGAVGDDPTPLQRVVTRGFAEVFGPLYAAIDASLGHYKQYPKRTYPSRSEAYYPPTFVYWPEKQVNSNLDHENYLPIMPLSISNKSKLPMRMSHQTNGLRKPFRYRRNQRIRYMLENSYQR